MPYGAQMTLYWEGRQPSLLHPNIWGSVGQFSEQTKKSMIICLSWVLISPLIISNSMVDFSFYQHDFLFQLKFIVWMKQFINKQSINKLKLTSYILYIIVTLYNQTIIMIGKNKISHIININVHNDDTTDTQ